MPIAGEIDASTASAFADVVLRRVLLGLDTVAVELHNTGRRSEVQLDEQVIVVFAVQDGRIATADNLISDVPGLNAFFAASSDQP